jgi:RNA polymerase sigma-70 factor (ECF subfamily)
VTEADRTVDAELLRLVRQGSKAALGTLYRRYLPSVWRYVYTQVGGDEHIAEDVVSETFLSALHGLRTLEEDGRPLYPWLIGVARHKLGDHRRKARLPSGCLASADQNLADGSGTEDPPAHLELAESRGQVTQVMAQLVDEERLVLEWKYVDEMAVKEIAVRLGRTEKAVESLLYRARKSFRAAFPPD